MAFFNTLVVSGSAVMLSLCVGMPAAYAFARFPFRGRSLLFFALLVMRMLPPIAVLMPMYVLFSKVGLTTTRLSVVLAYSTFTVRLVVWIMLGFFEDLPREWEESAWIDGPSRYGAFVQCAAPGATRHDGGKHPVPATRVERFPVRRGPDQQRHADAAG